MRNKVSLCVLLLMSFSLTGTGQNLVPNYSFEDTIQCPIYGEFQGYITGWGGRVPGYFSPYCYNGIYGGEPQNGWGFQYPHTGKAYTGIYTFIDSTYDSPDFNLRDYLQAQLISTLVGGMKYYITFYVSLGDSEKYACNNIGAYFSDSSLNFSSRKVLSYHTPQVTNDTLHNPLTDKINWMKVSGSFIAKGGEQYMIIGNFKDDAHSDTVFVNSLAHKENIWTAAYYYVDDVIVSTDSNYADSLYPTSVQNINKPKEVIQVYPNPSNTLLTVQFSTAPQQDEHLCLYNLMGEQVESVQLKQSTTSVSVVGLPAGIYLYRVLDMDEVQVQEGKIMVVH